MTKDELEKEAEKHADGIYHYKINVSDYGEDGIINYRYSDIKEAYIKGAEPREKRIAELEKENAKAKEIIKKLYAVYYEPCVTESDLKYRDELFAEIKQFLNSEVEK